MFNIIQNALPPLVNKPTNSLLIDAKIKYTG